MGIRAPSSPSLYTSPCSDLSLTADFRQEEMVAGVKGTATHLASPPAE